MTELLFCYCCRVHHPKALMRLFATRHGQRWRCLRSIEAATGNRRERDAFGQRQTEINHEAASHAADLSRRLRRAAATTS